MLIWRAIFVDCLKNSLRINPQVNVFVKWTHFALFLISFVFSFCESSFYWKDKIKGTFSRCGSSEMSRLHSTVLLTSCEQCHSVQPSIYSFVACCSFIGQSSRAHVLPNHKIWTSKPAWMRSDQSTRPPHLLWSAANQRTTCGHTSYLVSARRYGPFVNLMRHVTTLKWGGDAPLWVLISRPVSLMIVAPPSATSSTSVSTYERSMRPHAVKHTKRAAMEFANQRWRLHRLGRVFVCNQSRRKQSGEVVLLALRAVEK